MDGMRRRGEESRDARPCISYTIYRFFGFSFNKLYNCNADIGVE